jgi:hypothetical protein
MNFLKIMKMWQNVAKVRNMEKIWRDHQKYGKSHIYNVKGPPSILTGLAIARIIGGVKVSWRPTPIL